MAFDFLSPWLAWALVGLVLIVLELVSTTFVIIFFGIGALITALATKLGVTSFPVQAVIFCLTSLALLLLLRRYAKNLFCGHADRPVGEIGQKVPVTEAIAPGGEGRVKHRGSPWIAFSDDPETIPVGTTVEITDCAGIRLKVKRI